MNIVPAATPVPRRRQATAGVSAALVAAGLMAACAAPPASDAAASAASTAPTARLLLRGAVPAPDQFSAHLLGDGAACLQPRRLTLGTPQKAAAPATLPTGAPATLAFVVSRDNKPSCESLWTFTPLAGKTYLMAGAVVGAGCTVRLFDATLPDRPTPVADAVPRSAPGQRCLSLDQARARFAVVATSAIQGGQVAGEAVLNPHATAQDLRGLITP